MTSNTVIFFAPHASIWSHSFPEALVAEALRHSDFRIKYIGCRSLMSRRCTTFDAQGLQGEITKRQREAVCGACTDAQGRLQRHFGHAKSDLEDYISAADLDAIDASIENKDIDTLLELTVSDIPVGRYATYETLLTYKKRDLEFNDVERQNYLAYLRGCLIALAAFERVIADESPVALFTYNSWYSANHTVSALARRLDIAVYTLHAGPNLSNRLQTLMVARDDTGAHARWLLDHWPRYRTIPCSRQAARRVTDHMLELLRGRSVFVYSTAADSSLDIRARFGVKPDQRLLLATMSSYDERFAAEFASPSDVAASTQFDSQLEWVQWLIDYVKDRESLFLVIRLHPRDFPNKRESQLSDQALLFRERFQTLPDNVAVNWPHEGVSLYDFAAEVDVLLNGWSSAGKEFAILGLPVVAYSAGILSYPAELNCVGETSWQYADSIERALKEGWSLERARLAYRWLTFEQVHSVVDISDGFSRKEGHRQSMLQRISNRVRNAIRPGWREEGECLTRPKPVAEAEIIADVVRYGVGSVADLREVPVISNDVETMTLIKELHRLAVALKLDKNTESPLARGIFNLGNTTVPTFHD